MQSFIIVHSLKDQRDTYLEAFFTQENISPFDITRVVGETSLGIENIRDMQKHLYLSPVKGENKAIILEEAQTLTTEAQNALLKVLEEPPLHAVFFLSTTSIDSFLPTVLSRCSLISLEEKRQELNFEQTNLLEDDLKLLYSDSISSKLHLAEKVASQKDEIGKWLATAIVYLRHNMLENVQTNHPTNPTVLKNLQKAYHLITTTNTSPRIILEHTFLHS